MPPQDNKTDQVIHLFIQLFQVIGSFLWTWAMLKFFTNPHEKVTLIIILQTFSIGVVLNYILLIPFDIFVSVRHSDIRLFHWTDPIMHHDWLPRMYDLYLICYVVIMFLGFIFVPFQIFYVQSVQEEDDLLLETQIISQDATTAGANKLKGMDSSSNSDDEETHRSTHGDSQPQSEISSGSNNDSKQGSKYMKFVKDFYNDSPKEQDIINIYTRTSLQKFSYHGTRASKRTCVSVVVLAILLLMSRWITTYEYKTVHEEYEKVHDDVAKKVGHHIENSNKQSSKMKKGEKDDGIESEEDFNEEGQEFMMETIFGMPGSNFNATHFFAQSKKRAHAIYSSMEYKKFNNWKHQLMDNLQEDESSLRFVLTTLICLGSILNCIYMTYGLAGLPIQLINGQIDLEPMSEPAQGSIAKVRDQLRIIQEKYRGRKRHHISLQDKQSYKKLKRDEKLLNYQNSPISAHEQSRMWRKISSFIQLVNVHRIEIGKACLATSFLISGSMLITNVDRFLHSECGFQCGYLLDEPQIFNPLDYLLRRLSSKHNYIINVELYLDIALFFLMSLYCIVCIFFSFVKIGINLFTYEIYKVKRRETLPQALSFASVLIILMMIAFSMQVMTIAPLYTMFGDQRVDKEKMEICTLKNGKSKHDSGESEEQGGEEWGMDRSAGFGCQMTMMSQLYNKMELGLPAFAILEYFMHCAFVISFFVFLAYHGHYKESYLQSQQQMGSDYAQLSLNDGDDQEDEDLSLFLKSTLSKDRGSGSVNQKQQQQQQQIQQKNSYDTQASSWDSQNNYYDQYNKDNDDQNQYDQNQQYDQSYSGQY